MDSLLVCDLCSKKFRSRASIRRHIVQTHNPDGIRQTFECYDCSKKFPTKFSVKRHIMQLHQCDSNRQALDCSICCKTYSRRDLLMRHVRLVHPDNGSEPSSFECARCKLKFSKNRLRIEHILRYHPDEMKRPSKFSRLKCLKCGDLFQKQRELNNHYTSQHDIKLVFDKLHFSSFQKFEEWFENMKCQTITNYKIYHRYKTATNVSHLAFICHRSRGYSDLPKDSERKRSLKTSGYKGLDGHCPAEIKLAQLEDGTCDVVFQQTHVGHAVGDTDELKHIYLSESQKRIIAAKLQSGIPVNEIRKQETLFNARSGITDRLDLLNKNDMYNIAAKYKINVANGRPTQLPVPSANTETFVEESRNKILFYKCQGEDDCVYKKLKRDDFALVIMDETYANYLRLYGHKVIAFGNTRVKNLRDCILHTLLVLDNEEEGLPVAFLISNRSDRPVVDIFLSCIRDRVGVIKTRTLITDLQLTYYSSWSDLMAPPQFFLFCFWRVCEVWRRNYSKVAAKEKRAALTRKLLDLAKESNILAFEEKLASFLTQVDEDTKPFIGYFKEFFSNNTNRWAYCFRQDAGVNTNACIHMFHRVLKSALAESEKGETIHQCLVHILECLISKQAEILRKQIRGKVTPKLVVLRKRHRVAFLYCDGRGEQIEVTPIGSSTFLVTSFEDSESEYYTVRRNERKNCIPDQENSVCNLLCTSCNICFHEFCCSCQDYSIKNNMCLHIHWLGLWLQNNRVKSEEEIESNVADDTSRNSVVKNEVDMAVADDNSRNSVVKNEVDMAVTDDDNSSNYWREKVSEKLQQLATDVSTMSAEHLELIYTKFLVKIPPDTLGEVKD